MNLPSGNGSFVIIVAQNPTTVCCPEALLVTGLRTLGVALHPLQGFAISHEEIYGQAVVKWQWLLADLSADGVATGDLIKRWNDAAWLAANPTHELAIVKAALSNIGLAAREIRETIPRLIVRQGRLSAHIPADASPAKRQHALDQLEGRIPLGSKFVEQPVA